MSALFLLTHDANIDRIQEDLSDAEFTIIQTNLSPDDETQLKEKFAAEEIAG